ncbi:MAG: TetR/AcrR family transcriptional regulator, partial [Conexibacter sp.]
MRHISGALTPTSPTPDTRARILHATLRVIAAGGVGAVSNRRVAAEAGVALGSLTYHFPSQTDLLRESLLLYAEEEVARLERLAAELRRAATDGEGVSAEQAAAVVEQVAARDAGRPEEIAELELHLHASRDPQLHEASRRCFAAYESFAAAALGALR